MKPDHGLTPPEDALLLQWLAGRGGHVSLVQHRQLQIYFFFGGVGMVVLFLTFNHQLHSPCEDVCSGKGKARPGRCQLLRRGSLSPRPANALALTILCVGAC